jgi:hypothetical protein
MVAVLRLLQKTNVQVGNRSETVWMQTKTIGAFDGVREDAKFGQLAMLVERGSKRTGETSSNRQPQKSPGQDWATPVRRDSES